MLKIDQKVDLFVIEDRQSESACSAYSPTIK